MSEYNFDDAFSSAFPQVASPDPTDYGDALAASGVTRAVSTMTLDAMGATVSAAPGTNPPSFELVSGTSTPGSAPSATMLQQISATAGAPPSQQSTGRRSHDPFGDYNFVITIDDCEAGAFRKCDGLTVDVDVVEYRDGMSPMPLKRPGMRRFGDIKLTKGQVSSTALWEWCQNIMDGKIDRRNGSIQVIPESGDDTSEVMTYEFYNAWPKKWSGLKLDGMGKGAMVEEIVLAVESIKRTC